MLANKLIVALDMDDEDSLFALVDKLDPAMCRLKVGSEIFTRLGPPIVKELIKNQFDVFLDLKFHDIPNTIAGSCKAAADMGVWMLNVHASAGIDAMHAAYSALESFGKERPLLIGVTVLTSMSEKNLQSIGAFKNSIEQQALHLAELAHSASLDGVVCSAREVSAIKKQCGQDFVAVTPGIRPKSFANYDQTRVATPLEAIQAGSDYLVVGRPVTRSLDPMHVVRAIVSELNVGVTTAQ